jgi:hypothetical protein
VGEKTIKMLRAEASQGQCSMWAALGTMRGKKAGLDEFIGLIEELQRQSTAAAPALALLDCILEQTNYFDYLKEFEQATFENRKENVEELRTACFLKDVEVRDRGSQNAVASHVSPLSATQFNKAKQEADAAASVGAPEDPLQSLAPNPIQHFLTHLALVAGDPREGKSKFEKVDAVNLLTMHAAKGLEWPVVFVVGCDDTTMPHNKAEDMNEERRLLYVALTRAKALLHVTHPQVRFTFTSGGRDILDVSLSRFLKPFQLPTISFVKMGGFSDKIALNRPDSANALITSMCLSYKLKEPPAQLERRSSSAMALDEVLPLQRNATAPLLLENEDSISDSEEDVQAPSRSDSLRMLPLEFHFSPNGAKKQRRKSESDAPKESKKRKRDSSDDVKEEKKEKKVKKTVEASSTPPPAKRSKIVAIDLTEDDDVMDFKPFAEKPKRQSPQEIEKKAEENRRRLEEMRKQAKAAQARAPPKPSAVVTFSSVPKSKYAPEKPRDRTRDTDPKSSTSYSMQRASGAALPSVKPKK